METEPRRTASEEWAEAKEAVFLIETYFCEMSWGQINSFFIIEIVCDLCEEWAEAKETVFIIETNCDLCEEWTEAKETVFIIETNCDLCEVWSEAKETVFAIETDWFLWDKLKPKKQFAELRQFFFCGVWSERPKKQFL
jgi:hypothetical protein